MRELQVNKVIFVAGGGTLTNILHNILSIPAKILAIPAIMIGSGIYMMSQTGQSLIGAFLEGAAIGFISDLRVIFNPPV